MSLTYWVVYSILFWGIVVLWFGEKLKDEKFCDLIKNNPNWRRWLHPNSICTFRVLLAWLATSIFIDYDCQRTGVFFFTFAAYLDGVDGMVARACNLGTEFGEWYDPICDKLSYVRPLFHFWQIGIIESSLSWVVLLFSSDLFGQFAVRWFQKRHKIPVAANIFGKVKTVLAFALIIYSPIIMDNSNIHNFAGELFRIVAILALVSAVSKLIPKSKYVRSVIVAKLICSASLIYLVWNQPRTIFWPILISVMIIDALSIKLPIINLETLKKMLPKKDKTAFVLFAAFIFVVLAFSLKSDDAIMLSGSMVTMSTFFLLLGRLKIA